MQCRGISSGGMMATIVLVLSLATAARGSDITANFSAYGTLGGTFTSDGNYQYYHSSTEFKGASNEFDVALESRIGAQADVDLGSGVSIIVQELAEQRGSTPFSLGTEWAFIQYAPTSDVKLRLGRVALSAFLFTDTRNVGYAQPWFRAPNDVYYSEPYTNLDGGQGMWHVNAGPVGLDFQGEYGISSLSVDVAGVPVALNAKYMWNVSAAATYQNLMFRIAETKVVTEVSLPLSATDTLNVLNSDNFLSLGMQYDDGRALFLAEWTKRTEPIFPQLGVPIAESKQWYVGAGWRYMKVTPMLIYGKFNSTTSVVTPPGNMGTLSASIRYDILSNVALKFQISRPEVSNGDYFIDPNYASTQRVNVYSIGADFVIY